MSFKDEILCSKTHEYVLDKNGCFTIGITDYAVEQLGDIVFIELPEVGAEFMKGEVFATIESVKAASEIYMPITGRVLEVNDAVVENPELLNENPYESGWLIKVESETASVETVDLLDYNDYKEEIE